MNDATPPHKVRPQVPPTVGSFFDAGRRLVDARREHLARATSLLPHQAEALAMPIDQPPQPPRLAMAGRDLPLLHEATGPRAPVLEAPEPERAAAPETPLARVELATALPLHERPLPPGKTAGDVQHAPEGARE